ncbi:type VII secretion protein EccCa [Micromonospora yangpuensis]|uniref:DNA segregation ATPase FtsK/SpoIIIE, S-DNA-T family n=1 Tax=Micromonospora yangpuensis TaxID=683228 RepID=A0A1C6U212_9ACTN|nr:type VII secretion protein EccCa [Micromonospora yangpuensis]GGM10456.1 type VII secretion protein EccC [Micromonospora yangpuensis]SCL48115.1 DNA segregation ATPase FtsK/SpoIIIE, S-DNA-T family [Micromonospora yangpuensis]
MTTRIVHRPARVVRPVSTLEPVLLEPPPQLPDGRSTSGLQSLLPMAGAGVAMSMMMFLRGSGFAALGAVVMVVALAAAAAMYLTQLGRAGRQRRGRRERYQDRLEELRERLRADEQRLQEQGNLLDPPVIRLLDVIRSPARLWERRRTDVDFLRVRVGSGALPVRPVRLREESSSTEPPDPFMRQEAQSLIRRFERTPGLPLRVDLDCAGDVSVIARDHDEAVALAGAILVQVAAFHAPDDVTIAIVTTAQRAPTWRWARWLPHLLDRASIGPSGPTPLLVTSVQTLAELLGAELEVRADAALKALRHSAGRTGARTRPRLLVVDDAYGEVAGVLPSPDPLVDLGHLGVTVVHLLADRLHEPGEVTRRITVDGGRLTLEERTASPPVTVHGTVDEVPMPLVEGLARAIAPLRLSADSYDDGTGTPPADFPDLLGLTDPAHLDLATLWRPRSERDFLRVPIGVDTAGRPVLLDLKEAAQLGMGPHGLCVGATGSGKSELLRTLVLALAASHPPEQLAMVLVDYKGGATFAPFTELPHICGLITNLVADAALVDRMYTSLDGEVQRRQQLLADAGRVTDITEYHLRRTAQGEQTTLPALPHLLVLIDEFGELLAARSDFIDLFLRIGRIGRSIGVHLLLSSQRIEQGKMRGLENYLAYRLGLRTLSEMESRTVLDTPDAFHLPPLPGNGYLKVDTSIYQRFKAAYVSGPLREGTEAELAPIVGPLVKPMPLTGTVPADADTSEVPKPTRRTTGPTLLSTVVDQLAAGGRRVPAIWLPPLPPALTLDQAAGGISDSPQGLRLGAARPAGPGLPVPLGRQDDPARQAQGPWLVDLAGRGGNLLVLGGPGTGKTTTLRTLALGLATSHRPTEVGVYGIDLLGNGLSGLAGLPHVGGVASRDDRERVRRTVDEVHAMFVRRQRVFRQHQFDTVDDLRAADDRVRAEVGGVDVVLLIDGYGQLNAEFESLEPAVHDLLARGSRYGVHVVATARRWNEVRAAQQVAFANRVELRLTEPAESSIDGKLARAIPPEPPGRALTSDKLYAQVALPRLDGLPDPGNAGLVAAAELVRASWTGALPPPVRVLPAVLPVADLADIPAGHGVVPFGRFESDFTPAVLDLFGRDQHLLVLGDPRTGKTNLLRLVAEELMAQYTEDELVFAVFDPRRGLADVVPESYRGGYAPNPTLAQRLSAAVCQELAKREPSEPARPRIVLLVDDYDILAASATQPLGAFVPYVAAGRDTGLHVVVARRVAGASRGLFEPFPLSVREAGCLSLLMSGDRTEGQLFAGVRPTVLPVGRAQLIRPGEAPRMVQTAHTGQQ